MAVFGCRGSQEKIGVLVAQLGTPDAPTRGALYRYLKQFLWDPRVIETNRVLWWFILNCIILPTRPSRSAKLYKRIWRDEGSPLLTITRAQTEALWMAMSERNLDGFVEVEFGMRYGNPSLESAVDILIAKGCSHILLFPMYPQYAAATTAATYDVLFKHLLKRRWVPTLQVAEPYYVHEAYIRALAVTINEFYQKSPTRPEKLVLSYHGIPEKYVTKGDPYCCMCTETTKALLPLLEIPPHEVIHTYQSRFGRDPWLVPYTDETIEKLGKEGVKHIAVAAPGFTADCLETLDELGNEGTEAFHEHGGETLSLIPCLNTHPAWTKGMGQIVHEEISLWLTRLMKKKPACSVCPTAQAKKIAANEK